MKTPREKFMILGLPALLILAVYVNWFNSPLQKDLVKANNELRGLQSKVSSPGILVQKSARLNQLTNEWKQVQDNHVQLEQQWKTLAGLDEAHRSEKIEELAESLKRHGLNIIEQTLESGKQGTVPHALDAVGKRMGDRKPQVWRFRMVGSYASMLRVLDELTYGDPAVTPLGLTMKEIRLTTDLREWTLVVWI
jgi:type II secretory pathway component PulM